MTLRPRTGSLLLIASLIACSGDDEDPKTTDDHTHPTDADTDADADADADTDTDTDAPEPVEVQPEVVFVDPANGTVTELAAIDVTVEVTEGDAAGLVWTLDGVELAQVTGPFAPGDTDTLAIDLLPGSNVVAVTALAPSGSEDTRELVLVLDAPEPPVLSLSHPSDGALLDSSSLTVEGEVFAEEAPARAQIDHDGLVADLMLTEAPTGVWSFTHDLTLPFGDSTIVIEVEDDAGRVVTATREVSRGLDALEPELTDVWPSDGHGVASARPTVWGIATDNDLVEAVYIEQDGVQTPALLLADGAFRGHLDLAPGSNDFAVVAVDASGNETRTERTVWLGSRVSAGGSHSGWVQPDGSLLMWGRNNIGQVGVGYTSDLDSEDVTHPDEPTLVDIDADIVSLVAFQNSSVALDSTGSLWGWGENGDGQLGQGTADPYDLFVEEDVFTPSPVPGASGVVAITGGYYHVVALLDDGTVQTMGRNGDGQLGDGSTEDRDHLVAVPGLEHIVQVAAASSSSFALTSTGELYAWGANDYAQLGAGLEDDDPHSSVGLVPGLPPIAMVAAGRDHVLALTEDGSIYGWGLNASTQIGGASHGIVDSPVLTPTALPHLGTAVAVYSNGNQSYLETVDGRLWGWGQNGSTGALGVSATGDLDAPIDAVFGLTDLADAGIGALHTVALRTDEQAFAWGWSFEGSLGAGAGVISAWGYRIPIQVQAPE